MGVASDQRIIARNRFHFTEEDFIFRRDKMPRRNQKSTPRKPQQPRLQFAGLQADDIMPSVCIIVFNQQKEAIYTTGVEKDGTFDLSSDILKKAHRLMVGPLPDDDEEFDSENALVYRPEQFAALMELGNIGIAEHHWRKWFWFTMCVTGSVKKCSFLPWWWHDLSYSLAAPIDTLDYQVVSGLGDNTLKEIRHNRAINRDLSPVLDFDNIYPAFRCETVCVGTVEVYERRCCCDWIIDIPWLEDLVDRLEDLLRRIPDIPIPLPDPFPPDPIGPRVLPNLMMDSPMFEGGTLNQMAINAQQDLHALNNLPMEQIEDYILARPYLYRCTCGAANKIAEGDLNPDGTFNICWQSFPHILLQNCHYKYAYVIKQTIDDVTHTIYDGRTANEWFNASEIANLQTTYPFAVGCPDITQRVNDAAVYLDLIGDTESWRLGTPLPDSWDSVAAPAYNSGLLDPVVDDLTAAGQLKNRNLGGLLRLRYMFTWQLKQLAENPTYYRISWIPADNNGNPQAGATRTYFSQKLVWQEYEALEVNDVVLGPQPVTAAINNEDNLYKIPYYDGSVNWTGSVDWHAQINTTQFDNGRYLLMLELFDDDGHRLHPTGTAPAAAGDIAGDFNFLRWLQETASPADDFVDVPYAALTHMLWWDNRPVELELVAVHLNGTAFNEECMFLTGEADSTVQLAYRAYHNNPRFLHRHTLTWQRGFNGPGGSFGLATPDALGMPLVLHGNVGTQPGYPAGISQPETFEDMLGTHKKCVFTVTVRAHAKTTNGSSSVSWIPKQGAFALEIE